jgi:hypothetical protein
MRGKGFSMLTRRKLKNCDHRNTNVFDYVRRDALLDQLVSHDDYNMRREIRARLTGLRYCLDCGSTQRYSLSDPLDSEQWLAPWIWR